MLQLYIIEVLFFLEINVSKERKNQLYLEKVSFISCIRRTKIWFRRVSRLNSYFGKDSVSIKKGVKLSVYTENVVRFPKDADVSKYLNIQKYEIEIKPLGIMKYVPICIDISSNKILEYEALRYYYDHSSREFTT